MTNKKRIVVIGGSAAGPKAAARARRLDGNAEIVILQEDTELSMSSCAYPYYIGGVVKDRRALMSTSLGQVRDQEYFAQAKNIIVKTGATVTSIDPEKHVVVYSDAATGQEEEMEYSKLVISTGAVARMPDVIGADLKGIFALRSLADAEKLKEVASASGIEKAVILGGGAIGLELCESFSRLGISVTVVEAFSHVFSSLDPEISMLVENYLRRKK